MARFLRVLDDNGDLIPYAQEMLLATMHFPDEVQSQNHCYSVLAMDHQAIREGAILEESHVGRLIRTDQVGRRSQGVICGHVFLSLLHLQATGLPISIARARDLVFEQGNILTKQYGKFAKTKGGIKSSFSRYKNVAHYWTGVTVFADVFDEAQRSSEKLKEFLRLCGALQSAFYSVRHQVGGDFDLWNVPETYMDGTMEVHIPPLNTIWASVASRYTRAAAKGINDAQEAP
ncbi:MAG: hypothetical protein AAGA71_18905 [Pseudomonadota bacterium]